MKKISWLITLCLIITGCTPHTTETNLNSNMRIELIIGVSGIDDKSFNQSAWEAVQQFASENNIPKQNINFMHSMTEEDFITNLSIAADKKPDVIVAPGYYFATPLIKISEKYPDQKFILLDAESDIPTIASVTFNVNEGSFLAGVAAALKADEQNKDTVGFLGGIKLPIIENFKIGFEQGVHAINPDIKVIDKYANDFTNPIAGRKLANELFNEGAYIIYNVAGDTGNGSIDEAKDRALNGEDVWIIGVDKDQYDEGIYKDGKSIILTSMLKRIDVATYDLITAVANGTFEGKHIVYTLKNNGVGFPENNPNLTKEWEDIINDYREKIINNELEISSMPDDLN